MPPDEDAEIDETGDEASMKNFFYYFAYGSNLLKERIRVQNKGAVFDTIGLLHDFELGFFDFGHRWHGALASIRENPGAQIWGCVWKVPHTFAEELDRQECGYHRLNVPIETQCGRLIYCRTYQYSKPNAVLQPPSPHYKHVIVCGAIEHDLPAKYVEQLKAIPDNGYGGRVDLPLAVLDELNSRATG